MPRSDGTPFKKPILRMKEEAAQRAKALGHRLYPWGRSDGSAYGEEYAYAFCPRCKGGVSVHPNVTHMPPGSIPAVVEPGIHGLVVEGPCLPWSA